MPEPALQLGVIGDPDGWHVTDLARAGRERGHRVVTCSWTQLASILTSCRERLTPTCDRSFDSFVIRGMPRGGLEEVIFRMNVVARLEAAGKLVVNSPRSLEIAIDKYLTTARVVDQGIPVPATAIGQEPEAIRHHWNVLGGDVVFKPLFGSGGRGMERIRSRDELETFLRHRTAEAPVYLQEFVPHPEGDFRVLLIGKTPYAVRRRSRQWRTNISLGGLAEPIQPTPEMLNLAQRAAVATGAELAGVDLIEAEDGRLLVLEVNAVPGWKALAAACKTDIAAEVIRLLERKAWQTMHGEVPEPPVDHGRKMLPGQQKN
jgi:ribosomal protein S6--L-glutamate ligase